MPQPSASALQPPRWDPWVLWDKDRYRLFYLSGRTDQEPWWKISWICGATSADFLSWQHTGVVLEPLSRAGWESGRLFAGSVYKEAGVYYLFYSAASASDISKEAIGLAISTDAQHWQRQSRPLLSFASAKGVQSAHGTGYGGECNWANHLHWRDPYVVKAEGQYYLFFCASLTGSAHYQGGLGVAIANRLGGPYQLLPPAAGPGVIAQSKAQTAAQSKAQTIDASDQWPFYHLERPQVIFYKEKYHLFFSCFKAFVNPLWLEAIGADNITDSTLYWYVSDYITGPFEPAKALPTVPGSESTGLYGTTFFLSKHQGDWQQVTATSSGASSGASALEMTVLGWYHEDYTLAVAQEFKAVWDKAGIQIVAGNIS